MRYAALNLDIIHEAVRIAKEEGLFVSLDLASFEVILLQYGLDIIFSAVSSFVLESGCRMWV